MYLRKTKKGIAAISALIIGSVQMCIRDRHYLEEYEIYVSSGSACSKGAKSGVLSEFGLSDRLADSALRISICRENTISELRTLAETIEYAKERLIKSK